MLCAGFALPLISRSPLFLKESKCDLLDSQGRCWLVLNLASTINPWSFLAGSNVASSPVSFVLLPPWKLLFLVTFPICLVSHQQCCWLSCALRAGSQCQHCLQPQLPGSAPGCVGQIVSWKRWVCGLQVLRGGKADISASGNAGAGCCSLIQISEPSSECVCRLSMPPASSSEPPLLTLKPSLVVSRDGGSLPVFILVLHSLYFTLECSACTGLL